MKRIFKTTLLMLAAMQATPGHAMWTQAARAALAAASKRTVNRISMQPLHECYQTSEQAFSHFSFNRSLVTLDHESSHNNKQNSRKLWKLCAGGSILTAIALASQKTECQADEIENPYGPAFFEKAGFKEGLPYWYLAQFAIKFNNAPLKDNLKLEIRLARIDTYQSTYLPSDELVPVWNGFKWQSNSGYIMDNYTKIGGITIRIVDNNKKVVASCILTAAGMVDFVHVNYKCRGKGYGSMLLAIAKQIALESGISKLYLHVCPYDLPPNTSRQEAFKSTVRFYQKNGFSLDKNFCLEKAMNEGSDFSRMVCYIQPDAPIESSYVALQTETESKEFFIAKALLAYAVVTVGALWWLNR